MKQLRRQLSIFIPLFILLLAGCTTDQSPNMQNQGQNGRSTNFNVQQDYNQDIHHIPPRHNEKAQNLNNNNNDQMNLQDRNREAQEVADRLVHLATRIEQVNDATAVVVGKYAVVGIDVDANLDRSRVGTIKYSVAEALKADPKGAYAIITADVDTNQRLRQMAKDIRNGKPIEGVMDELAAIVGRIMPQVPRHITEAEEDESPQDRKRKELSTEK